MIRKPDTGYSWLVLAASLVSNLLTIGFLFGSIGVLVAEYNKMFNVDVRTSSWTGSVLTALLLCSGPLAAYLVGRLGCRLVAVVATCLHIGGLALSAFATQIWMVILTFSIISGFASSCCHVSTMKILTQYFVKYQHLAFAAAAVGSDLATVSFPFISRLIFDSLSYKYGVLALSAVLLPAIPCGMLFIEHGMVQPDARKKPSSPTDSETTSSNNNDESPCHSSCGDTSVQVETTPDADQQRHHKLKDHLLLLKRPSTIVFLLNTMLWNCGGAIVGVLAYSYYLDIGLTSTAASTGMTLYGVGSLMGSVSLAAVSARLSFNRLTFHWLLNVLLAVFLFAFPSVRSQVLMSAILAAFGFSYGTLCANLGSLTEHINGPESLYLLYSYEMAAGGVGSFVGPGVSAYLQKTYGSATGFYFGGSTCAAALLVMVVYTLINPTFIKPVSMAMSEERLKRPAAEPAEPTRSDLSLAARL